MNPYRSCILLIMVVAGCGALIYASTGTLFFVNLADAFEYDDRESTQDILTKLGVVRGNELTENSGIARSHLYPDSVWCHNDSGHSPTLYLVRTDGTVLARCPVSRAQNADWEDIGSFEIKGTSYLVVGDVGDNRGRRQNIAFYLIKEPALQLADGKVVEQPVRILQKIVAVYEDGARNCEAIGVCGASGELYLVEKKPLGSPGANPGVYSLDLKPFLEGAPAGRKRGRHEIRRVADFPVRNVTGMAFSADSKKVIIRDYLAAHLMERREGESWQERFQRGQTRLVPLPIERQGEAICFEMDGQAVITTSEFARQPIWKVEIETLSERDTDGGGP
ncbi:MAG: hypothetical protein MK108_04645 [Mariniblastus sp.]|nr:hypothetical protein [Mariniblastus sp.]